MPSITPTEAAKLAGFATRTRINQLIKSGKLSARMCECGHSHLLDRDEVLALAKERKRGLKAKADSISD